MPLFAIAPDVMVRFLFIAVLIIALIVVVLLGLLYGLKKIFGKQFNVNYNIEFKSTALFIICSFLTIISFMVIMVDDDRSNKVIAWSILVGSLGAIGVNIKYTKLPDRGSDPASDPSGASEGKDK